ncbi:MAG TPA: hypothetical protein VIL01_11240 [Thermomicrobiales bacterium]
MDEHPERYFSMLKISLAILFAFQVAVIAVVFIVAWSSEAGAYAAIVGWPWLIIGAVAIAGPLAFRWRLVRVRARRARLIESEWTTSDTRSSRRRRHFL